MVVVSHLFLFLRKSFRGRFDSCESNLPLFGTIHYNMERRERWLSLAIFFSFYEKVSGADLTHVSQICPCLELSISRQPLLDSCESNLPLFGTIYFPTAPSFSISKYFSYSISIKTGRTGEPSTSSHFNGCAARKYFPDSTSFNTSPSRITISAPSRI